MPQFSGLLFPDKSFSLGAVPLKKARKKDKDYEHEYRNQEEWDINSKIDWLTMSTNILGDFVSINERPLFIESVESSRISFQHYGKYGITRYGKRFVRNAAILMEKEYGKRRLGFVTCTLPDFPIPIFKRLIGNWGDVVRRFYQKVRRHLKKIHRKFVYVGVTEIQEKRYKSGGLPAPHLHFVYVCKDSYRCRFHLYVCQIHRAWNLAIREVISKSGYPLSLSADIGWGSVHCKSVQKTVAGYLGKYISKGTNVLKKMTEDGYTEFPRQWWTGSTEAKKMYKDALINLKSDDANELFYNLQRYIDCKWVTWSKYVDVRIDGIERTMGLCGIMSQELYDIYASHSRQDLAVSLSS